MGARDRDRLTFTVVGSGTATPEPDRVCSGYFIDTGDVRLLVDCGPGVIHHLARLGLPWAGITHVAITHFHNDHTGDLAALFFAWKHGQLPPRAEPLTIVGPAGLGAVLDRLAGALGGHVRDPGFPLAVVEPDPHEAITLADRFTIAAAPTRHTDASVAYRVVTPAGSVGFTGDTGYDEDAAAFLRGVDLLVMECSLPDAMAIETHLTPSTAARMAVLVEPGVLLATHVYPVLDRDRVPGLLREAGWDGPTRMARDGLGLRLEGGRVHD